MNTGNKIRNNYLFLNLGMVISLVATQFWILEMVFNWGYPNRFHSDFLVLKHGRAGLLIRFLKMMPEDK